MKMDEGMKEICAFMNECCKNIVAGRSERWENIAPKIENEKEREVIGAMIVRMMVLAVNVMKNANGLNYHIAPIVMRTMADCHITLFWMLTGPKGKNIRQYVKCGLKEMEKRLSCPTPEGLKKDVSEMVAKAREDTKCYMEQQNEHWGNAPSDNGSKSGIVPMFTKADAADEKEFYKNYYSTFSGAVHSSWVDIDVYKQMLDIKEWKVERDVLDEERAVILYFGQAVAALVSYSWERLDKEFKVECQTQIPLKFWLQHFPENSAMLDKRFNG